MDPKICSVITNLRDAGGTGELPSESFQKVPFCLVSLIQQDLGAEASSRSLAGGTIGIVVAVSFSST